jgi:hypothetical protein
MHFTGQGRPYAICIASIKGIQFFLCALAAVLQCGRVRSASLQLEPPKAYEGLARPRVTQQPGVAPV